VQEEAYAPRDMISMYYRVGDEALRGTSPRLKKYVWRPNRSTGLIPVARSNSIFLEMFPDVPHFLNAYESIWGADKKTDAALLACRRNRVPVNASNSYQCSWRDLLVGPARNVKPIESPRLFLT
jgi:hypothetical protein